MNKSLGKTVFLLTEQEKQWQDCNQTLQKIDKRIWAICARMYGRKDNDKFDRKTVGELQKSVISGKCQDGLLTSYTRSLVLSREPLALRQTEIEGEMCETTAQLPIRDWFCGHRGLSDKSLAHLVGIGARDWNDFERICQLWKWYGRHVVNGRAPRRQKGVQPDFSSIRRAVAIGIVAEQLIRQETAKWKPVYDWYKARDYEKMQTAGFTILPQSKITKKKEATGKFVSEGRMHNRARRYTIKQFIREMWEEWTGDQAGELPGFVTDQRKRIRLSDFAA